MVVGLVFLAVDAAIVAALFAVGTHRDYEKTMGFARENITFLENTCEKYDNYIQGKQIRALRYLEDATETFDHFLPDDQVGVDDDLLEEYANAQNLSGMMILDGAGNAVAHFDADRRDPTVMWQDVLTCSSIKAIYRHEHIDYSDIQTRRDTQFAVYAVPYGDGAVFAYDKIDAGTDDSYEYSVDGLLSDNTFHENPTVAIVQDGDVVSTNRDGAEKSLRKLLVGTDIAWRENALTPLTYDNGTWYGVKSVFRDYTLYVLYPKSEVLSGRAGFVAIGLLVYLVAAVVVLVVRVYIDRRNLKATRKQLDIIDAISSTYDSTFLLHLDTMQMEPIRMSPMVEEVFSRHEEPHDFLDNVCRDLVMPEYRELVAEFMDPADLVDRLEGKPFLGLDMRAGHGSWYSLQVIPQHRLEDGTPDTVLVATRDVTVIKRAEELSYRDKLTGLRNRNYLESHAEEMLDAGDLPVSIIMVDCNYLKRTNDTLGHEWGDRLLQRVSAVLQGVAGDACLPLRIGGDEFMLVCPHTDEGGARQLIENAKEGLAEVSDELLTVSAAFGASTVHEPSCTFDEAFATADGAMYAEKQREHAGR